MLQIVKMLPWWVAIVELTIMDYISKTKDKAENTLEQHVHYSEILARESAHAHSNQLQTKYLHHSLIMQGGDRTTEEMCLSFFAYYPQADLSVCVSQPTLESFIPFIESFIE